MRSYRLLAGVAAGLIAIAGVLSVTAGGSPAAPPPVTLRGSAPDSRPVATDGLEFVPPSVVDLASTSDTVTAAPDWSDLPPTTRTSSPAAPPDDAGPVATTPTEPPSPSDPTTADSPDPADVESVDSPDSADSPDD